MNEIFDVIANVIVDVADISRDDITEESHFIDTLDLSSLEIMAIVAKLEQEFSIKIEENELLSIANKNYDYDYYHFMSES